MFGKSQSHPTKKQTIMTINSKLLTFFATLLLCTACKTKQIIAPKSDAELPQNTNSAKQTIDAFYKNQPEFKTLYIKADIDYKDDRQAQSVTADIKIEKDKTILVSIRFLGFTVAKALLTPNKVQYYEKIGSKYFEGDFSTISQWLGTDLDFQKIQNMIIGQPFENLSNTTYNQSVVGQNIQLVPRNQNDIEQQYVLSQNPLLLVNQLVSQPKNKRQINIEYSNHEQYPPGTMPKNITIFATENTKNTSIKIEQTKVTFNEELTFGYSVPSGYEKLEIKQ